MPRRPHPEMGSVRFPDLRPNGISSIRHDGQLCRQHSSATGNATRTAPTIFPHLDPMHTLRVPVSSYRLQFGTHLGFADARLLVPYLEALGITTCYASPLLQAAPGSAHGYDICDHDALNHDLGSDREFDAFAAALRDRGMGLILDFVPNHMGLDPSANRWWHDVLQHG